MFITDIKEATEEQALGYLLNALTDDPNCPPLTSNSTLIPVFEDARLYHFIKKYSIQYEVKFSSVGAYIILTEENYDKFVLERKNVEYDGLELITPSLLYFLNIFKISRYDVVSARILRLTDKAAQ